MPAWRDRDRNWHRDDDPSGSTDWDVDDPPEADSNESATVRCRKCDREVYEDAFQCPYCGEYVEWDTSPWSNRPLWWVALAFLGIVALILALVLGV